MVEALKLLKEFQNLLNERNEPDKEYDEYVEKLSIFENAGLFYLTYYGMPFNQPFQDLLLKVLAAPEVATRIRNLTFLGPDEGANGTRNWDFSPLLETDVEFPELTTLFIEPGEPDHHNQPIVAKSYDEEGMLGKFLLKAPKLSSLTSPTAPDGTFFKVGERPIYYLRIETGYDHQNFIHNLSQSSSFPQLRALDFGDFNDRYMPDYQNYCTPFEHYRQLFESEAFSGIKVFNLRNSILIPDQLSELKAVRKNLAIKLIQSYSYYG